MRKILSVLVFALAAVISTHAAFEEGIRQAAQLAVDDARAALRSSGLPADQPISLLPLEGDVDGCVEGLLKIAVTDAQLTYVEGKADPFWDELLEEIEWDERKQDILDNSTLAKFGKLKATRLLMYGTVRDASQTDRRAFVEIELHVSSVATKAHLWGGLFTKRHYFPEEIEGIISLDDSVREVLKDAFDKGKDSLSSSKKLAGIETVALVPLAGDIDNYVTGLAENMIAGTQNLYPKDLDLATLAEARQLLKDQPQGADALLYGAVRNLYREKIKEDIGKTTHEINAEVQLRIQSAQDNNILWSETLHATGEEIEKDVKTPRKQVLDETEKLVTERPRIILYVLLGIAGVFLIRAFLKSVTRPR